MHAKDDGHGFGQGVDLTPVALEMESDAAGQSALQQVGLGKGERGVTGAESASNK